MHIFLNLFSCLTLSLLFCTVSFATQSTEKERMPLWDRIALSDIPIYTSEGLDQQNPPQTAKKGTWARFIRHSDKFTTELVELESGGQYWIQETAMCPLYYVVGKDDLIVIMMMEDYTDQEGVYLQPVVLAHPGDTVAVDHFHKEKKEKHYFAMSLDGKTSGFAPMNRLEPVGDSGMGLAGD